MIVLSVSGGVKPLSSAAIFTGFWSLNPFKIQGSATRDTVGSLTSWRTPLV